METATPMEGMKPMTTDRRMSKIQSEARSDRFPDITSRILIVDDQPEIREVVSLTFSLGNYELQTAQDGREALEQVVRNRPDLVILDVAFPDGPDGIEVCRQIKRDPATQSIRVVLLTSLTEGELQERARDVGADGFLTKPFSPLELIGLVDRLLERREPTEHE
jgi:CheY-like chemotaxis protein